MWQQFALEIFLQMQPFAMLEDVFKQFGEIKSGRSVVRHKPKYSYGFVEANAAQNAIEASPVMWARSCRGEEGTVASNRRELTEEGKKFWERQEVSGNEATRGIRQVSREESSGGKEEASGGREKLSERTEEVSEGTEEVSG